VEDCIDIRRLIRSLAFGFVGTLAVCAFGKIAVMAEHLKAFRVAVFPKPQEHRSSWADFPSMLRAIIVDMINGKELDFVLTAAGASHSSRRVVPQGLYPALVVEAQRGFLSLLVVSLAPFTRAIYHARLALSAIHLRSVLTETFNIELAEWLTFAAFGTLFSFHITSIP